MSAHNFAHLYHASLQQLKGKFFALLPFSFILSLIYFISRTPIPLLENFEALESSKGILWAFVPSIICAMAIRLKPQNQNQQTSIQWWQAFIDIPALYGVIISMLLTPLILGLFALIGYWLLEPFLQEYGLYYAWIFASILIISLGITNKIVAPIIMFFNQEDVNTALEHSEKTIHNQFWHTYIVVALIATLFACVYFLPVFIGEFVVMLPKTIGVLLSSFALLLLLPLVVSIWVQINA